jgi:hypothetical protein
MNVYKSGLSDNNNRVLITLFIPVRAKTNIFRKNIINKLYAKYRTDLALVVSIVDDNYTQYIKARSAFYNETIIYKIGSLIKSEFNPNINIVNGKGIHFFIDRNIALNYGRPILEQKWIHNYINTPNLYQSFYSNGSLKERIKYTLKDNKILNEHVEVWYENGYRKFIDNYILGKKNGYAAKFSDTCLIIPEVNKNHTTPHSESFQTIVWHLIISHPKIKVEQTKWESLKNE